MAGSSEPERQRSALSKAAAIQLRVIWALMLREVITRFGRHNIGFLWLFVEPMLFTLGVTTLWSLAGMHTSSVLPITAFALTGYSTVLLWRNMPMRCVGSIIPNSALMYHRQVKIIDIFLSRMALEAIGATMSFALLSVIFIWIGWMSPPENLLLLLGGWFLTAWFGSALALVLGTLSERYELVEKLWHPAAYLLFPMSGAAFLVEALPTNAQQYVLILPMVHCTEMVRDGYFGSKFIPQYDVSYLVICNMVMTLIGLMIERVVSREFIPE